MRLVQILPRAAVRVPDLSGELFWRPINPLAKDGRSSCSAPAAGVSTSMTATALGPTRSGL